ncbi:MAG: 4-hydroxythreonine-4-phosphate dehydrogenase PdxA [Granulosicoccus sp.]
MTTGKASIAPIAITPGEPAGIGPDLTVMLAQQVRNSLLVAIADPDLLSARARKLGLPLDIVCVDVANDIDNIPSHAGALAVNPVPLSSASECGVLDSRNARYVLNTLDVATDGCMQGHYSAMVTAPLHKGVINDAGIAFTGHTEYLALRTGSEPVMMLATGTPTGDLRVALATTHLPLKEVATALTPAVLEKALCILHQDLMARFAIADPHIVVAGLNPHAGEGGHMGREEIDVIIPVLERLRQRGMKLEGPLPADTLFTPHHLKGADAVMAMFHDQGLPVLKYAGFGQGINITLGLPIIRTSVDHGTALDKAGTGKIDRGSLQAALNLAEKLAVSSLVQDKAGS